MATGISRRADAARKAWRTFWWMVVRPKPGQTLSRKTYLGIAFREARCGLMSGGQHSWGPLIYEYEGAPRRKQWCRWCRASMTPASEFDRNPPRTEDMERARTLIRKPTEDDAKRALKVLEDRGIYRDGRFLWD